MKPPIVVAALLAMPILEVLDDFQAQEMCRADLAMSRVMCLRRWPASGIAQLLTPFPTQLFFFKRHRFQPFSGDTLILRAPSAWHGRRALAQRSCELLRACVL
jgi:hypothetical protein